MLRPACALVLLLAAAGVRAAGPAPQPTPDRPEPKVQHIVVEDDLARIEELRVRGLTRSIVVRPKAPGGGAPMKPYEIVPADGGRDLADGPHGGRGAAGQRVWNVLVF